MITVVHPTGNANVRAVLDGLLEAEILNNYHTTIATYPKNTFGFLSKLGPFSEFGDVLSLRVFSHSPIHILG